MKGKLTDQPLVELIREISSKGLSGTLRLQHERVQCAVYFEEGRLVFAASNLRTLRLRAYLEKGNLVTKERLADFGNNISDLRLASALHSAGIITGEQVNTLLASLVSDVLRVVLLWDAGSWEFDERARINESFRVGVDVPNLLREASHRMPLKFVSSRFRNPNEMFARATMVSKIKDFLPAESFILSRLDAPLKLDDLVAVSGLPHLEANRIIYGLALSGFLTREYWQNAFRTGAAKPTREQAPDSALFASQFEKADEETDLQQFLQRVSNASDHYEIFELPLKADSNEVKDAYYGLARRYHPDRFHLKSGTSLHADLGSAFARVTQAYETLMNPNARAAYDSALERARQFKQSAEKAPRAADESEFDSAVEVDDASPEHNFREGFAAFQQGRINAAINHLAVAARHAPNEARYRAYYGRALGASERTQRLAEAELQAAVRLEPTNATYHTLLAELYLDLQFHKRAQTELERALSLDPNNAAANSLQRKLQKLQKTG
jgi:curved DNA-binding protein CbpA